MKRGRSLSTSEARVLSRRRREASRARPSTDDARADVMQRCTSEPGRRGALLRQLNALFTNDRHTYSNLLFGGPRVSFQLQISRQKGSLGNHGTAHSESSHRELMTGLSQGYGTSNVVYLNWDSPGSVRASPGVDRPAFERITQKAKKKPKTHTCSRSKASNASLSIF